MPNSQMIDIYDLYKPFRNSLRKFDLQALLLLIWDVQRRFGDSVDIEFRSGFGDAVGSIFKWELHLLAREALLHSTIGRAQQQPSYHDLIKLINHIRRITEGISLRTVSSGDGAMRALHPLIHQQARWQYTRDWDRFYRIFRIYNRDDLRPLLEQVVGVRLSTIYTLAFAIAGSATRSAWTSSNLDYKFLGISAEERDAFFAMVSADHVVICGEFKTRQRYDEGWPFSLNPLEQTPLVRLRADRPHEYLCPLPELLLRRTTESLFFDLGKSETPFNNPYGMAFQAYVGDVLRAQFTGSIHRVMEEQTYKISKKKLKHGVDWIVSDPTGHIMFECKARRMKIEAKATADGETLTKSLEALADLVVQHYKNVEDALLERTHWKPDSQPVFPVIVTLEDWYLFSPHVIDRLHSLVREKLVELKLASMLETSPFIVVSIAELETAGQAIAQIGIGRYFSSLVAKPNPHFGQRSHAAQEFPDTKVDYQRLFSRSDQEMFGHLAPFMELPGDFERQA